MGEIMPRRRGDDEGASSIRASSRIYRFKNVEERDDIESTLDFKAVEYSHIMTTHYLNEAQCDHVNVASGRA
jgi:hypothetical protein